MSRAGSATVRSAGRWDCVLLFALVLAFHGPTMRGDFIYDSIGQVLYDDFLHQPEHLWDVLTLRVLRMDVVDRLRPVQLFSLLLDAWAWGRNPVGYRLTSVLWHSLNAVLVFLLIQAAVPTSTVGLSRRAVSWLGALMFAIHPATVEAVAEPTFREDLLATAGIVGGLLTLATAARRSGGRRGACAAAAALLLTLAALSKETGWLGPGLALISFPALARRRDLRLYLVTSAVAALLIAAFAVYARAVAPAESAILRLPPRYPAGSFRAMMPLWPRLWLFQLFTVGFPFLLCADYGPYSIRGISTAGAVVGLALIAVAIGAAVVRRPRMRFGLLFFAAAFAPTANLVPMYVPLADRYLYLPLVGLSLTLATLLSEIPVAVGRRVAWGWAAVLALWIPANLHRQWIWQDRVRLWEDTLVRNPLSRAAANNRGFALFERGQIREALAAWQYAVQIHPKYANSWVGVALAEEALGNTAAADAALARAIAEDPVYADADRARQALAISPDHVETLRRLLARRNADQTP